MCNVAGIFVHEAYISDVNCMYMSAPGRIIDCTEFMRYLLSIQVGPA